MPGGWRFWIDRGGTFTDVIGLDPAGKLQVRKVLSERPDQADDPAVAAIRAVLGLGALAPIPEGAIAELRLGTTVATNALLEHRGAPVLLLINRGFADLLAIGDQHRPDIFALRIEQPRPLALRVIEVEGRLAADGSELEPLRCDGALAALVGEALAAGYGSGAVALLHAYRNPAHELALGAWLEQQGVRDVALSHQLSRQPRLVPRGHTTLVEAAVGPILRGYLQQVQQALGPTPPLRVMRSSGALAAPQQLRAKDTILSGPAGGMVGAVAAAAAVEPGVPIVGVDMGGTSTDVFHFDPGRGEAAWERSPETEIAGLRLQAPMLPVHTVAAGGGSIIRFDGGRLLVGPESAGAEPGPAGYRRGGPATITDANLLLGRLPLVALPRVFGPAADQPVDPEAVQARFEELARASGLRPELVAEGALALAIERMATAIRRLSIQRGHDIRAALLVSYGGAGGQHACRLAETLGMARVLLHPLAGVLSAYGIGMAEQRQLRERALRQPLTTAGIGALRRAWGDLRAEAEEALRRSGDLASGDQGRVVARLELRYPGSERGLEVLWPEAAGGEAEQVAALQEAFAAVHRQRFGYVPADRELVVERLLLELAAGGEPPRLVIPGLEPATAGTAAPASTPVWLGAGQGWRQVPLWQRRQLVPGTVWPGPAVVLDATTTVMLEPGWQAEAQRDGSLLLRHLSPVPAPVPATVASTATPTAAPKAAPAAAPKARNTELDPVRLELFNHRFSAIAEQMGVQLQQSSRSVNIRERLDFSCALFDGQGRLVANAPHIPVHLGSMGESVVALLADLASGRRPPLQPGDVILSNDPYAGGTHLPDITAITPMFAGGDSGVEAGGEPLFFLASRGHHADVGGITPGSMPAFSRTIADEGLLLRNEPLLRHGQLDEAHWRQRLAAGPHPVRNPDQLLADLEAQVAANRRGETDLRALIAAEGLEVVRAYMGHGRAHAAAAVRRVLERLHDGAYALELDNGAWIRVAVRVDRPRRQVRVDFSGTSPQLDTNLNAPLAVTKAVVLYVFRCLVGEAIPLNAGCFEPIELVVPQGCLLNPNPPAAVVAGNVETSQATANALFAALGVQAAAQGTMNNLSFGDAAAGPSSRQYYETICGGSGAGVLLDGTGFAGAAAVQTHMTNSRLTDPEILEERFPVRLERFARRRGSGGGGRWCGGDGVVRQWRALEPLTVSLLSSSRRVPPFGLAGGEPGACGENRLLRSDGSEVVLPGCCQLQLQPGEGLRLATPGGGGYGRAEPS